MHTILDAEQKRAAVLPAGLGLPLNVIGNRIVQKLTLDDTAGAYYVFEVETPPGNGVPLHVHRHEDEIIYLLEGQLDIQLQGEHRARSGDTIHFPRFVPHAFRNTSDRVARTLWTVIPGTRFAQFFQELGALPAGPPDLVMVSAIFRRYEIELLP
jgi:quercetin dioxygenase-like cupin family protein